MNPVIPPPTVVAKAAKAVSMALATAFAFAAPKALFKAVLSVAAAAATLVLAGTIAEA